jgi:hypothetical protein
MSSWTDGFILEGLDNEQFDLARCDQPERFWVADQESFVCSKRLLFADVRQSRWQARVRWEKSHRFTNL